MKRRELFQLFATAPLVPLKPLPKFEGVTGAIGPFLTPIKSDGLSNVMYAPCGLPAWFGSVQLGAMCKCGHGVAYHREGRCSWGDGRPAITKHWHPSWDCSCGEFSDDGGAYQARLDSNYYKMKV